MVASNPGVAALSPSSSSGRRLPKPADRDREVQNSNLRRVRLNGHECSSTWADDLFYGRDRDAYGRRTGHGSLKANCERCGRAIPPQDAVDTAYRCWADTFHVAGLPLAGDPPPAEWICTDCRTIAPPDRSAPADDLQAFRAVTFERVDREYVGEFAAVPWVVVEDADGSPAWAVLDAMADANVVLPDDALPTSDHDELAVALTQYRIDGDYHAFLKATGEVEDRKMQCARRAKYGATRPITV